MTKNFSEGKKVYYIVIFKNTYSNDNMIQYLNLKIKEQIYIRFFFIENY